MSDDKKGETQQEKPLAKIQQRFGEGFNNEAWR